MKKIFVFGFAAVGMVIALMGAAPSEDAQRARPIDPEAARILRGAQISPVPLNFRGKDKNEVWLGSYIVNAQGGCNDCHTNPPYAAGGDPFQGQPKRVNAERYLAGGQEFGPFISANITPDADGKPAGLTFQEFRALLRTGHDVDEGRLLQVMPWPVYGEMTDHDLRAVYQYLSAIPHRD